MISWRFSNVAVSQMITEKILRLSIFLPINGLKTEDSIFKSVGQARFCSSWQVKHLQMVLVNTHTMHRQCQAAALQDISMQSIASAISCLRQNVPDPYKSFPCHRSITSSTVKPSSWTASMGEKNRKVPCAHVVFGCFWMVIPKYFTKLGKGDMHHDLPPPWPPPSGCKCQEMVMKVTPTSIPAWEPQCLGWKVTLLKLQPHESGIEC